MFQGITLNVLAFGLVSFFTDISSEMIYPLLPLFLTTVPGAGPAGLIFGFLWQSHGRIGPAAGPGEAGGLIRDSFLAQLEQP